MNVKVERQAGPVQGIVLLLQVTLAVMGTAILAPVIPDIIHHFRDVPNIAFWGPFVVTVPSLCIALCAPLAGWLADLVGRRRLLIAAIGGYAVLGVLPVFLETIPQILASRIALGIVEAAIMTVSTTMIGDYFEGPKRDKWLGYQTGVASMTAVGLLALGGVLGEFGWRVPFFLYLFAIPLMLLVVFFTWEPVAKASEEPTVRASWAGFPWLKLAWICVLTLIGGMLFYIVQIQLSSALRELGVDRPSTAGMLTAIVSIGIPIGTIIFDRVSRVPVSRLLAIEFGLVSLAFLAMSHVSDVRLFLAVVFVNQVGCGMLLPTLLVWAMRQFNFSQRGRGIGIWQAVFAFGPPLGPALLTFFAVSRGTGLIDAFQIVGLLGAAAFVAALAMVMLGRGGSEPTV